MVQREASGGVQSLLSQREHQLLVFAAQGLTDQGIAHKLGISLATVGTYWGRIRIKMGPLNRTELVAHFLTEEASHEVEALRSENTRLLQQVDEHSRTEQMLKSTLEMFRGLVETAPDAILLINEEGHIQLANQQAEAMFGYGPAEMLGLHLQELIPVRLRERHQAHRLHYNANPERRQMGGTHLATPALRKDGTEFPTATALSATQTPNGLLITCIVRDLGERLNASTSDRTFTED